VRPRSTRFKPYTALILVALSSLLAPAEAAPISRSLPFESDEIRLTSGQKEVIEATSQMVREYFDRHGIRQSRRYPVAWSKRPVKGSDIVQERQKRTILTLWMESSLRPAINLADSDGAGGTQEVFGFAQFRADTYERMGRAYLRATLTHSRSSEWRHCDAKNDARCVCLSNNWWGKKREWTETAKKEFRSLADTNTAREHLSSPSNALSSLLRCQVELLTWAIGAESPFEEWGGRTRRADEKLVSSLRRSVAFRREL
jgi:hypothetical protein